jgi:hypothetical protein
MSQKIIIIRTGRVAQAIKCLSSKFGALSSNPSTAKKIIIKIEILSFKETRMNLGVLVLSGISGISQAQKAKYYKFSLLSGS